MTEERKQQLITNYAVEIVRNKYPDEPLETTEDLQKLLDDHKDEIVAELGQLSDDDFDTLGEQYKAQEEQESQNQAQFAAKGAKLQKLKAGAKKCKCGCAMVTSKEKGGKLVSKCACGCDVKKAQAGAKLPVVKKPAPSFKDKVAAEEKAEVKEYSKAYPKSDVAKQAKSVPSKKPILKEKGGKVVDRIAKAKLIKKK